MPGDNPSAGVEDAAPLSASSAGELVRVRGEEARRGRSASFPGHGLPPARGIVPAASTEGEDDGARLFSNAGAELTASSVYLSSAGLRNVRCPLLSRQAGHKER